MTFNASANWVGSWTAAELFPKGPFLRERLKRGEDSERRQFLLVARKIDDANEKRERHFGETFDVESIAQRSLNSIEHAVEPVDDATANHVTESRKMTGKKKEKERDSHLTKSTRLWSTSPADRSKFSNTTTRNFMRLAATPPSSSPRRVTTRSSRGERISTTEPTLLLKKT